MEVGLQSPPNTECPLSRLPRGRAARVLRVDGAKPARIRLLEMGLIRGTPVEFIRSAPLGDPIEVRVRSYCLSLRRHEADSVIVEYEPQE